MKKLILIINIIFIIFSCNLFSQDSIRLPSSSYIIPDIGAPGMNVYIELIAHTDSLGIFGNNSFIADSSLYIKPTDTADEWKIQFSPLFVSWGGRLITVQAFIHPMVPTASWMWYKGVKIQLGLYQKDILRDTFDFYIVRPCKLGDMRQYDDSVFGEHHLGMRSPRGAMLVDSLILANRRYTVSMIDCDTTKGNQAYLPFTLTVIGNLKGEGATISVDANEQDGGVGGGGGGGAFYDSPAKPKIDASHPYLRGGNGFTGGGVGGVRFIALGYGVYSSQGGGCGSGSNDLNNTFKDVASWSGGSLNKVKGAKKGGYESAGGGTGHPFGKSGDGSFNDDYKIKYGGYGAASGVPDGVRGGSAAYCKKILPEQFQNGMPHGNSFVVPLAGGSGGGSGNPKFQAGGYSGYGGGGGGAIAINALEIELLAITASGAKGSTSFMRSCDGGDGSDGAVVTNAKISTVLHATDTLMEKMNQLYWAVNSYNPIPKKETEKWKIGLATDTTKSGSNSKQLTITGYYYGLPIKLYIKAESEKTWTHLTDIQPESNTYRWEYTIEPSLWAKNNDDSIYYFFAVIDATSICSDDRYAAIPQYILTQAAANVIQLKLEKLPFIEFVEHYQIDTIRICGSDTTVSLEIEKIWNKGRADLIVYKSQSTSKLNWEMTVSLDKPLNNDEYSVAPKDSAVISVHYEIPQNSEMKTYYDTISIWHNDPQRPNPWVIYVEFPLKKMEITTNTQLIDLGNILTITAKQDTTIVLTNPNNLYISYSSITCNSTKMNYTFKPIPKMLFPDESIKIIASYAPKPDAKAGAFSDTVEAVLDCGELCDIVFIGTLEEKTPIITKGTINLGKITKCGEILYVDSLVNNTDNEITVHNIKLYGPDSVLFSYAIENKNLPIVLQNNEKMIFEIMAPGNTSAIGIKTAYFDIHVVGSDGVYKLYHYNLIFEIIENALVAIPSPLYFETVVNSTITQNIKLEYKVTDFARIDTAYLKIGTIFNLNNDLKNHILHTENDFVNASISCTNDVIGVFYDTLVVVLSNRYCYDSLFVPISAKIGNKRDTNFISVNFDKIHLCDSLSWKFAIDSKHHSNTIIDTISQIYGTDKEIFSYIKSHDLPLNLEENDKFELILKVQSNLLTTTGKKTANVNLFTTENNKIQVYIFNLEVEVAEGIIATPNPIDFGTLTASEAATVTKKIDVINQDVSFKKEIQIKDVKLKLGENFILTKTIPIGSFSQKDSIVIAVKSNKYGQLEDTVIIVVAYPLCDDTLKIAVKANIALNAKMKISASEHNLVEPNSLDYKIPIYITSSENFMNLNIDTLVLTINNNLFYLKSIDNGVFSTNADVITIHNILIPQIQHSDTKLLLTLNGDVLLGDTDSTSISITKYAINSINIQNIDLQNGYLKLKICTANNDRLLNRTGHSPIVNILENPVYSAFLELECNIIESGDYSLDIIDVLGNIQKVKEWKSTAKENNKFRFSIPINSLGNGNYIVVMNTPSAKYTARFIILK